MAATLAGRSFSDMRSWRSISSVRLTIGDAVGSPSTTVRPTSWQSTYRCGALPWISPTVTPE